MNSTIKDVAKLAGVSTRTVSRVINNQGELSAETRARVQAAIKQLGYRPNVLARSLVYQRTYTLAVIAWGIDLFATSRIVLGIEQQSDELGYSMFLNLRCKADGSNVASSLETLIARQVDGIIYTVPEMVPHVSWVTPDRLKELPPIVFLTRQPRAGLCVAAIDNRAGGIQATEHLIQRGYRRIGLITGPMNWWEARERTAGWREALLRAKLIPSQSLIGEGDWSAVSGAQAIRSLLEQEPELDAVFACNDQMALGALGVLHELGYRVPQDIALVGFDNIPESALFWPSLTTVNQPLVELGRLSVIKLHKLIEAKRKNESQIEAMTTWLTPEIVVRASTTRDDVPALVSLATQEPTDSNMHGFQRELVETDSIELTASLHEKVIG